MVQKVAYLVPLVDAITDSVCLFTSIITDLLGN